MAATWRPVFPVRGRLRLRRPGRRLDLRVSGDWTRDPMGGVDDCYRAILVLEKLMGESIHEARAAGHSWAEVGRALGVTETAASFDDVADAFAAHKRRLWWVFWSDMSEPGAHS